MTSLAAALEREHQDIDQGIADFAAGLAAGRARPEPLDRAMAALRRHIYLEERFLFPALRDAGLVAPVFVMLREHGQIWQTLDEIEAALRGGGVTADVLKRLTVQLQHHNIKEERILYPQADQVLAPQDATELAAFLDSGRMPDGWVCERATGPVPPVA